METGFSYESGKTGLTAGGPSTSGATASDKDGELMQLLRSATQTDLQEDDDDELDLFVQMKDVHSVVRKALAFTIEHNHILLQQQVIRNAGIFRIRVALTQKLERLEPAARNFHWNRLWPQQVLRVSLRSQSIFRHIRLEVREWCGAEGRKTGVSHRIW